MISPQPSNKDCTKWRPYPSEPWVEVFKQDVDRTLLRQNLKKSPDQRLAQLQSMLKFVNSCRQAKRLGKVTPQS